MSSRHAVFRTVVSGGIAVAVLALPACAGAGAAHLTTSAATATPSTKAVAINKQALLHPKHKYFGIFLPGAPKDVSLITDKSKPKSVVSETGKQPNLVMYYQSWGPQPPKGATNFDSKSAANACAAGLLPMWTWESWDSTDTNPTQGVAYSQPKYAVQKIINGAFDTYIRATARAIKALRCPIAIRLDHEQNGSWYPWGLHTLGMGSGQDTPARYVKMWRHVWNIFKAQGATNVLWVWSPNYQKVPARSKPTLADSYPGDKYVDWVGIDGYYFNDPTMTFTKLFGATLNQLKPYTNDKPLFLAETGVGGTSLTAAEKASQIKNLVNQVAKRPRFNGIVYFDQTLAENDRADWRFDQTPQSLAAFKKAIDSSKYAAGKPGTLTKK
jgi:mannan endo-1,4-beta-mannosidase